MCGLASSLNNYYMQFMLVVYKSNVLVDALSAGYAFTYHDMMRRFLPFSLPPLNCGLYKWERSHRRGSNLFVFSWLVLHMRTCSLTEREDS